MTKLRGGTTVPGVPSEPAATNQPGRPAGDPRERVLVRAGDLHLDDLADQARRRGRLHVDDLVALGAALHHRRRAVAAPVALARALDEDALARADELREVRDSEGLGR